MRAYELEEQWSKKYKSSINCNNPKGFSQRAHCAGRKKNEGVAEGINPDITNPEFSHEQQIGDYLYVARYWSKGLKINAYDGNKKIGHAELMYHSAPFDDFADPKTTPKRIWLESEWTEVHPKYQRQGVMSTMYAYAKMLGNSVKPSWNQSLDARKAWKSWGADKKYLTQESSAEVHLTEFTPPNDSWGDNGDQDPYGTPKPEHYSRSIDFFGRFEADHFDQEDMNDDTGEFKGYWYYGNELKQIAYFKFDNPKRTGSNHPGMGWYYEPQNEEVLAESINNFKQVHAVLRDFLPVAMSELKLKELPKIHIKKNLDNNGQPSFGSFNGSNITLAVSGRHPIDICRTLAHELTHYRQGTNNQLDHESGETGSPEENEANSVAGIIMRKFSQKYPEYMKNESQ